MKKILAIIAATAITAMAGTAMAATASLTVSANISNACSVAGGSLDFSALNPLTAPLVTKSSTGVSVTCTKGDAYSVSLGKGENFVGSQAYLKNNNNSDTIPYTVTVPAVSAATGNAQPITLNGTIAAGSYSTASAGTYGDTMVITVTP